jgi:hypothetical protein
LVRGYVIGLLIDRPLIKSFVTTNASTTPIFFRKNPFLLHKMMTMLMTNL